MCDSSALRWLHPPECMHYLLHPSCSSVSWLYKEPHVCTDILQYLSNHWCWGLRLSLKHRLWECLGIWLAPSSVNHLAHICVVCVDFPFCGPLFLSPLGLKQVVLLECLVFSKCLVGGTLFGLVISLLATVLYLACDECCSSYCEWTGPHAQNGWWGLTE